MQTLPRSIASQDVSTQMGARPASSFSFDAAVQTPLRSVLSHDTSNNYRSLSSSYTVKVRHQYNAVLIVPHRLNLLTLLRFAIPAAPALSETVTCTLWLHMSYCSHHRVSKSMPRLQVSRSLPTCALHMVYLSKQLLFDLVHLLLSQTRSHSHLWEHILLPAREVPVPPLREPTIEFMQITVQALVLFLNRVPLFFL